MGVAGDHTALVFVIHEGGVSYNVIIDQLTVNHYAAHHARRSNPIPHTNRLPIEPYTDIAVVRLQRTHPRNLGRVSTSPTFLTCTSAIPFSSRATCSATECWRCPAGTRHAVVQSSLRVAWPQ